jgi:lysophospholipase L1-like esterase
MKTFSSVFAAAAACLGLAGATAATASAAERYVALGDSYTSGPLIPNQHGDPIDCGRSDHNYPSFAANAIKPASFTDVSCGSAETQHMASPQTGLPAGGTNPPQFDALKASTTLVSVGIGGNDAGLVSVGEKCGELDATSPTGQKCKDYYTVNGRDTVDDRIQAAAPKVAAVLEGIHARSPAARVLIVGYPDVTARNGASCWPVVPLSPADMAYVDSLLVRINAMIAAQAAAHDTEYVDTYNDSIGHDVCKTPPNKWFEALVPTAPAYPLHPNVMGEESMGRSLLKVYRAGKPRPVPLVSPRLRITSKRFASGRIAVAGTIASGYGGRVTVSFNGAYKTKRGPRTTTRRFFVYQGTRPNHGRWRVVLELSRAARAHIKSGRLLARSVSRDGLKVGIVRAKVAVATKQKAKVKKR